MAETLGNETANTGLDSSSIDINKGLEQQISNWSTAGTVTPRENNPIDNPVNLPVSTPQINLSSGRPAAKSKEDDLVSALKSLSSNIQKGSGYHPEDYVYTSKAALPGDFTRYDEYTPGLDNEQLAYAKQTGVERVGKSVVNMANSFTKTLVESVTAPLVGTAYMLKDATQGDGVFNKSFYDNPYMKLLEKWQGFDLYESKQRRNAAWYSPDYWMTANSLNSVLTTVGDLAAFGVAGEFVYGKLLGAAAKPVSKLIDKNYWKAMDALAEFNAVIPTGAEGKAAVQELSQGLKRITEAGMADPEKVNASMKLISDISKRYASQVKTFNRVQQGAAGVVNFLGSAQASALESSTAFRNKMVDRFIKDNGRSPNEEEIMKIDEAANQVGATTGALMTVMGAVTLHGMGKSLFAKKEGEAFVRNEIKALSEAAPAEVEILGAKTKVPQYALEAEAAAEPVTKFGKVFKPIRKAGAGALRRLDPMTGIGFLEFGIAPSSVDSYYEKKYLEGDASVIEDALLPNVKNMFSKEGATSFFTGLFAGTILKGFQGRKGKEALDKNTAAALDAINSTYSKTYLKANVDAIKRGKILRKEYLSAIQDGDKEAELTLRQQMLENWLYPRIKYNSASMIYKELEGYRKIAATDEGIKELQIDGLIPEGDNVQKLRKDFLDHMDYVENYSRAAESYHDALTLKYGGYTDANGEPAFKDEHYEKLMMLSGSIDDANRRLKSLVDDIRSSELSSDPESQKIFSNLIKEYEKMKVTARQEIGEGMSISLSAEKGLGKITTKQTKEIFDRIRDLSINPDKKEELANKFADYLKLNIKKKQYLNEYESIVTNPELHKDGVVQNITGAPGQAEEDQEIKEKISLIHGNSAVVDGKVVPSEVELNTEYYVQDKPVIGTYNDKFGTIRDFTKFKIVGQKPDGKLIVTYEKNGDTFTREVDASYFKDKKISKASEVDKNLPAKFAMDHVGDIFVYSNPNVKLNGEAETIGDIFYDPADKQLKFRYAGKDGKVKIQNVDVKDFAEKVLVDEKTGRKTVVPAKIRYKDSAKRLTAEELDAIKKHKESEADREQRERVAKGKLEIIKELITKKKEALKKVEDAILDHEIDIEEKRSQISSLLEKIENYPVRENRGNLTKDAKKWLEVSMGTVRELGKVVSDIEAKKNELESQQEELQSEIDYLNDIDVTDLPNGRELLKFIQENTKKLESVILETGAKINSLDSFIKKTADTIKSLVDRFADYVDRFKQKYPDVPVDTTNLRNFSSSIEEYMDQVASIVGTSSPIIEEMQQMRSAISEMEELEVPLKLNDIRSAEEQISNLYADIKDLGKQIKISNELYDAFNKAVEAFDKEQARKALFDSPEARGKLHTQQKLINQQNNKSNPVNDPQEWQDEAKKNHKSTKSIDYVFTASVTPTYENRPEGGWTGPAAEHNNWVDRFNGFMTNRNLGFSETKKKEGERYVTDDGDYKANMKVIVVTFNNQKNYFGEDAKFIKPVYETGSKSVDNAKDKKDATIAYVFTYVAEDGLWFIDKDGKLISKVSEGNADPNQVVFTRMETADAKRDSGYEKYHAEGYTPEQIVEIQKKAEEERGKILEQTGQSGVYDYVESRGIANEEKFAEGEKKGKTKPLGTSVVDAKLVPENAIGTGIIVIPTLDANNENIGYVQAGDNAVPLPVGYPVLIYNNNTAFLSGKKFSPKEVDHLYNTIKRMAEMYLKEGKLDSTISNYLSSVLYFREFYGGEGGNNQFGLDGQGNLLFGINKKAVKFFPDDIEANKLLIKEFLSNANHNVSNGALREKGFNEITGFDKEGNPTLKQWESYESYLLSSKDPSGAKRSEEIPLTVNIKKLENDWESPFKNKYVRPLFGEDYFDKILPEKPKAEEVKAPETKAPDSPLIEGVELNKTSEYTDAEGNKFKYTPGKLGKRIIVSITSAVDKDGNELSKAVVTAKTIEIRDAITKPVDTAPEVKTTTEATTDIEAKKAEIEILEREYIKLLNDSRNDKEYREALSTFNKLAKNDFPDTNSQEATKELDIVEKKIEEKYGLPEAQAKLEKAKKELAALEKDTTTSDIEAKKAIKIELEYSIKQFENEIEERIKNLISNGAPKEEAEKIANEEFATRDGGKDKEALDTLKSELNKLEQQPTKTPEEVVTAPEVVTEEDPRASAADIADEYDADNEWQEFLNSDGSSKDMSGKPGHLLMEVVPDEKITDVGDRQAEKEFIEAVIPQIKYEELPEFIRTGDGSFAYGMYKNYYIALYKDAPIGTGYHEVWHGVEHSFLDDKTIEQVKKEFFGRTGTFVDRFGREIAYTKPEGVEVKFDKEQKRDYYEVDGKKVFIANEYDRKERLAEEFRQFKADNPAYKKPSLITNIFKRILNFINHFVLGKPETIEGIFKKINAGYYRHSKFVKRGFEGPEYSAMKGISEQSKADVLQGIAWKIIDNLRSSHGDLMKIAEGITVEDMFEPVYKQLKMYYEDKENLGSIWGRARLLVEAVKKQNLSPEVEKLQIENIGKETVAARKLWEYIKANKADVNKDLIDYFKKHKVIFTKDKEIAFKNIEESETETHDKEVITIEYYDDNRDRGYDRDVFKIDMKDSAPVEVKLLFSFLTQRVGKNPNASKTFDSELTKPEQKLNSALLPMAVDTSKYIYQVLDEMEGITDPAMIKRKLAEMAIKDPVLYALYAPIYKKPETLNDWRLQISFNKFSAKVKPDYVVWRITDDGRSFVMGSNLDTDSRLIISQWESDMRGDTTGITAVDRETGIFTLDSKKINVIPGSGSNKEESTLAFLKQLNFPVDSKTMSKLSKNDRANLVAQSAELYSVIKKGDQFKPLSSKAIKATALGKIGAILAKTGIVSNPSSHNNVNGEKVQNHIMFNRLNRAMAAVVQNNTLDKLRKNHPRLFNDTWSKDSMFLKAGGPLYDKDGKLRQEISDGTFFKMVVAEGLINDKDPKNRTVSTNKMNKAVRFLNMLNMNLGQGESMIFFNFIPADSTTESGVRMEAYIGRKSFVEGTYKKEFNELMSGYLKSEIELIKENMSGTRTLTENARKGDAYKNLQTFKDMLLDKEGNINKELVNKITEYAQGKGENKDMPTDNFLKSVEKDVIEAIDNYFDSNVKNEMKFLENYRILDKTRDGKYKFNGLNTDFVEKMGFKESTLTEKQVADVLKYRHINLLIHNTEMRKMFYGPWYEVPDSNKRDKLSMSASEKTYSGDQEFNTWAKQNLNKVGDVNIVNGEFGYHDYADDFNVVTYNHDKGIFSAFHDEIASVIGEEKAAPYKAVEESDAQGIVLDTHWKEYVLRSGDYWNEDYEKQHQFDLASARKEYYSKKDNKGYRKELMEADQKIIDQGDPMIYGVGNPKKPVAVGMLNNDSQNIPYSFKTSIMRLSYTVAKQRGLEDLYWWMHDNNIGMVGPKSFQKYGKLYSEEFNGLPELYKMDKDGNPYIGLKDVTKEQLASVKMNINWSDFNKIVEVPKGKSGKTMGSQLRSLAILNSFNYGMPVDFFKEGDNFSEKMSEWSNMNEDQRRTASARYRLYDDNNRAISEISRKGYETALDKLGMTEKDGEFEFTNVNKLVDFLRSEVTKRDIPENVSAGLSWKINDVTGEEELAQPLEVLPNYQALKNIIWSVVDRNVIRPKLNGTDLVLVSGAMWEKGIRVSVDKNGKKFLSSSELKFYKKGENGGKTSLMEVYAPNIFREKLAEWKKRNPEKATMSDKELLDYLNATDEGKKLLSAIGFRIPTQGLNSVDAVKIVDFLHPSMGDSIVVPSEIVTKVGADFDVDKMGTYYYNFYINKEGVPKLVEFLDDNNSTPEQRYIEFVNEHSSNKNDLIALKESAEFKETEAAIDNMYTDTKTSISEANNLNKQKREQFKNYISGVKQKYEDTYQVGYEFFRTLPMSIKQTYWKYENDLKDSRIKGIAKTQLYLQIHEGLIDAVEEKINQGITEEMYNYTYTDNRTKKQQTDTQSVDLVNLKLQLESLRDNAKEVLEQNGVVTQAFEQYSLVKDTIKKGFAEGVSDIMSDLKAEQKDAYNKWFFEAMKVIAEAKGIESFESFSSKDLYYQNSKEAVENKYYETLQDIVTLPDNYEQLITPNSSKQMTDIEADIARLQTPIKELEKKAGRPKGDVNYSKLLDPLNLSNERHDFVEAKGILIGIGAQNNTFHALSQTQPLFVDKFEKMSQEKRKYFSYETGEKDPATGKPIMEEDYEIYLPHNKVNVDGVMKTAYSGVKDDVGNFISDKISQYINGAVDAVKDTWLIRLIKDKDAMGTAIFLDRIGVNPDYVFKFINQPIVQEYIKQQSISKNVKGINPDLSNTYKDNVIANTMKLTYAKDNEKFEPTTEMFNMKDLNEMIRLVGQEGKQLNELSAEYRQMQRQILHEYIKYDLMAKDSLADQMAIMWGNISGITDNIIKDRNANYETASNNSVIGAAGPILSNTFQGQIKDSANKMMRAIKNILRVASSPALDHIEKHILDKSMFMKPDDRTEVLEKATLSLIDFATQTRTKVAGSYLNTRIAELLLSPDKNTAKLLAQMRKDPQIKGDLAELLKNPELLGKLTPFIPIEANRHRSVKIENKPKDSLDSGIFTEALKQLRDNPATNGLYRRLVLTGLVQSGVRDSRSSFNKLIPHEDYMKELIPAVDAILNGDIEKFQETMAFYRNNYQDARVVPNATKSVSGANEYVNYYNENNILNNHLPERIKQQTRGAMVAPKFLSVSNKNDLKHPVLKVLVRGIDPETGLEYTSGDIAEMQKKGDYTWAVTRLFQKVYDEAGSAVVTGVDSYGNKKYIYKQINAWGDGMNVQEHYEEKRPSVLPQHEKVYELEDWQVDLALRQNRFVEATKEQSVTNPEKTQEIESAEPAKVLDKYKGSIKSFIDQSKYTFVDIPDNFTEEQVNKLFNTPSEIKKYEKSVTVENFKRALALDDKYGDIISKNNIIVDFPQSFSNYVEERLGENDKVLSPKEVKDLLVSTEPVKSVPTQENQQAGNKPDKACP